jgi:hypothetical protein
MFLVVGILSFKDYRQAKTTFYPMSPILETA